MTKLRIGALSLRRYCLEHNLEFHTIYQRWCKDKTRSIEEVLREYIATNKLHEHTTLVYKGMSVPKFLKLHYNKHEHYSLNRFYDRYNKQVVKDVEKALLKVKSEGKNHGN